MNVTISFWEVNDFFKDYFSTLVLEYPEKFDSSPEIPGSQVDSDSLFNQNIVD